MAILPGKLQGYSYRDRRSARPLDRQTAKRVSSDVLFLRPLPERVGFRTCFG
jgi:hypothetical protein